jgi:hypothetical protein
MLLSGIMAARFYPSISGSWFGLPHLLCTCCCQRLAGFVLLVLCIARPD